MTSFLYMIGIEDEYFLVDHRTRNLRRTMSKKFFRSYQQRLKHHIASEMLQSQIEVMTSPCRTMAEVRDQVRYRRKVLLEEADRHDLSIMAASTHPIALWREQKPTERERYAETAADVQARGRAASCAGMHVHGEVPDLGLRIDLMRRVMPFLPLLLALSASSPFWQGWRTGLASYRSACWR
jgi:glutamate---cysteine ligase / carboxylate-amine ligase